MLEAFKGSSIELPVTLAAFYGFRRSEVYSIWKEKISHIIHTDVFQKVRVVLLLASLLISLLFVSQPQRISTLTWI